MPINIYKDQMQEAELLGKPVLYTGYTIPREEVPKGWHCYDLSGTDRRPGEPVKLMDEAPWDRAGTVLSPTPLKRETTLARPIKDRFLLTGRSLTLAEFCQERGLPQAQDPRKYIPRPASPEEAELFYALSPERNGELGAIGHVRMDFGRSGTEFWHTWWPRGSEELNTQAFKNELGEVVEELRKSVLKDLGSMMSYCYTHGGEIEGGTCCQNHGFVIETDRYLYRLRCNPVRGDYAAYLACFDKQAQTLVEKPVIGRISFASGESEDFIDPEKYLQTIREELPCQATTGFRCETLTDDPTIRKAVDDLLYDLYGEENPQSIEDYENTPRQGMMTGEMNFG